MMTKPFCVLRAVLLALAVTAQAMLPSVAAADVAQPAVQNSAQDEAQPLSAAQSPDASPAAIDWMEPQGISIVDMVGEVPEQYLKNAIIQYTPGYGMMQYISGQRSRDLVTITTKIYPRFVVGNGGWTGSMFGCLGQGAAIDQLGVGQPAGTVRLYVDGRDVTREVDLYDYVPLGMIKPTLNPRQSESAGRYRYPKTALVAPQFTAQGDLVVPANMGCEYIMSRKNYREISAVFQVTSPRQTKITVLGSQQFQHHSYLGAGYRGVLNSLVNQLYAAGYRDRAESFNLNIPGGTDHFFLNFAPSTADPYTQFPGNPLGNVDRIAGGTYRVVIPPGLTVDHVNSMGLPMYGHWQDVDQAGGNTWLPYAKAPVRLTAPEYFVPAGVPYNPCMINGGCPADLLSRIYNTAMTMQVVYLKIEATDPGLQRIPLRMVGGGWNAAASTASAVEPDAAVDVSATQATVADPTLLTRRVRLPGFSKQVATALPDESAGCSPLGGCGWFASNGRMVDYIPAP